ncbi:hypothetical protein C0995_005722 [Termitomyces sp. Mi166|nr:hypothetical protein C0995_005722 [Termitomyces sp. Mi166\
MSQLSLLRAQLNPSVLPAEILEYIFTLCVPWLFLPQKSAHPFAWTQVCRRWRSIALNAPRLWSHIDVCDARLLSVSLSRSATAPLHLISSSLFWKFSAGTVSCGANESLQSLALHAGYIHSIDILLFPEDIMSLFSIAASTSTSPCPSPSLPHLTTLTLKVPPVASNFDLDLDLAPMHFPALRRLALFSVSIPWTTCAGLTHLHLCGLVAGYSPSIYQLLGILVASPCIEELHLEHVIPTPSDSDSSSGTEPLLLLTLPALCHLHLTSKPPFKIHALLAHLALLPSTHLSITCPYFERLHDLFPAAPGVLFSYLGSEKVGIEHGQDGFSLFTSSSSNRLSRPEDKFKLVSVHTQHPIADTLSLLSDIVSFFNIMTPELDAHTAGSRP